MLQGAPSGEGKEGRGVTCERSFICVRFPPWREATPTSSFFSAPFSLPLSLPLFLSFAFRARFEFHNVIYGAWWNSFRFLGFRATEFTAPDILTPSFLSLTPSRPRRTPPIAPFSGWGTRVWVRGTSSLILPGGGKRNRTGAHVCIRVHIRTYIRARRSWAANVCHNFKLYRGDLTDLRDSS